MGNIMSFFFPQPAPASIEQVEEAVQEGNTTEEAGEETVAAVAKDAVSVKTTKTFELVVDKEIEATEVLPEEENDEGFEVVEENSLIEVNNLHQETTSEAHPEILSSKEKSPGPDDVEETQEESQTEIECIDSIEDNNVNLLREEAPTVKAPTPEPPRAITPELVKAPTPEPPRAITPEPVKAPTPEPPRALTPEPVKASTPQPPTAEPVLMPEPPKVTTPEAVKAPTPEPEQASSEDISSDVEVLEFSGMDDKKMAEEVSGGASGLRDILDPLTTEPEPQTTITPEPVNAPTPEPPIAITPTPEPPISVTPEPVKAPTPEPPTAITPEPVKALTPEPQRALTPEPMKAPTPEPPRAITPEPVKAPNTEPPRALTPEPVKAPTPEPPAADPALTSEPPNVTSPEVVKAPAPEPEKASSKDISSDVEVIEFSAEDDKKMAEEVSGGASGLRDILDEK